MALGYRKGELEILQAEGLWVGWLQRGTQGVPQGCQILVDKWPLAPRQAQAPPHPGSLAAAGTQVHDESGSHRGVGGNTDTQVIPSPG